MRQILAILALCSMVSIGCSKSKSRILYPSTPPTEMEGPASTTRLWNWDHDQPGSLPAGWRVAETHSAGKPATWAVVADPTAPSQPNVLAITQTENKGGTFNLVLNTVYKTRDLDFTLTVKANSGQEDQGGGPVWRAKDGDNYYVCRLNPLETSEPKGAFRLYKVVNGKRQQIAGADIQAKAGEWHTIRVTMKGNHIECYLDGQKLLQGDDDALADTGMIGLWTKADAASAFDDLAVTTKD